MSKRGLAALVIVAVAGWVFALWAIFRSVGAPAEYSGWSHRLAETAADSLQIVRLTDLAEEGFDTASMRRIQPHVDVLNAAMTTVISFHREYEAATSPLERRSAEQSAAAFHETATRHEQEIESDLSPSLRGRFHAYILRRESEVGLNPDSTWHVHGSAASRNRRRLLEDSAYH